MTRTLLSLVVGGSLLAVAATASAQEAVSTVVEGPGYPIGEGTVLHPTLGAEAGFTDNVFHEADGLNAAGIIRLIVEGAIASKKIDGASADDAVLDGEDAGAEPAAQNIQFRAGGRLAYTEFLSGEGGVRAQRDLSADLGANLVVAPEGALSFDAGERFVRDTRPTNFYSYDSTNRIANSLALGLTYQPGGRTMKGSLHWENQLDFFEDGDQRFANRMSNAIRARYEWKFFPYSKLFADASYGFLGGFGSDGGALDAIKRSAQPIRGGAGIATSLSEQLTLKAHVGWAYASYSGGTGYNTPVLGAEVGYRYSPLGRVVAEYNWDHRDSINGDYYRDHHLGGRVDQQFGRIVGTAAGELRLRTYHGIPMALGVADRDDVILAASLRASYVYRDWLAFVGEFRTESVVTDYRQIAGGFIDNPGYTSNELTAGVRAAF